MYALLHTLIPTLQCLPQPPCHTLPHQQQEQMSAEITYYAGSKINASNIHHTYHSNAFVFTDTSNNVIINDNNNNDNNNNDNENNNNDNNNTSDNNNN